MQAGFLIETMRRLKGRLSVLLQTSGYADKKDFTDAIAWADMVYFDLKLVNSELHKRYTGADNSIILDNLEQLDRSARVYRIRIPMIPGVTDTERNYSDIRDFIKNHLGAGNNLEGIDLLPYNQSAGGKYRALGRQFEPFFDEKAALRIEPDFFRQVTREAKIL